MVTEPGVSVEGKHGAADVFRLLSKPRNYENFKTINRFQTKYDEQITESEAEPVLGVGRQSGIYRERSPIRTSKGDRFWEDLLETEGYLDILQKDAKKLHEEAQEDLESFQGDDLSYQNFNVRKNLSTVGNDRPFSWHIGLSAYDNAEDAITAVFNSLKTPEKIAIYENCAMPYGHMERGWDEFEDYEIFSSLTDAAEHVGVASATASNWNRKWEHLGLVFHGGGRGQSKMIGQEYTPLGENFLELADTLQEE